MSKGSLSMRVARRLQDSVRDAFKVAQCLYTQPHKIYSHIHALMFGFPVYLTPVLTLFPSDKPWWRRMVGISSVIFEHLHICSNSSFWTLTPFVPQIHLDIMLLNAEWITVLSFVRNYPLKVASTIHIIEGLENGFSYILDTQRLLVPINASVLASYKDGVSVSCVWKLEWELILPVIHKRGVFEFI